MTAAARSFADLQCGVCCFAQTDVGCAVAAAAYWRFRCGQVLSAAPVCGKPLSSLLAADDLELPAH